MGRCQGRDPDTGARCPLDAEAGQTLCRGCLSRALQERFAFQGWMGQVTLAMESAFGLHPDDLPDCPYADWHGSGLEPEEAVRQAWPNCWTRTRPRGLERREER